MPLKRHTPSPESVWAEWERRKRHEKFLAGRPASARPRRPIPDNSTPWLPHPPRSIEDLIYISDRVAEVVKEWGPKAQS